MTDFLYIIGLSLSINMTIGLLLSRSIKNIGVVDVFWATGIGITAWVTYSLSSHSLMSLIIVLLISLWSIRLALFLLLTRIFPGHHDQRYQQIADKWKNKKNLRLVGHFYMQAAMQGLLCLCLYPVYLGLPDAISGFSICMVAFFLLSLTGQVIADIQLKLFKQAGETGVCQIGLWGVCRHPNYFFEVLMWLCLSLMMVPYNGYHIALLSPLSIWIITRFITGPYTERLSVEKRGELYKTYQRRVPMMVPSLRLLFRKMR